MSDSVRPHRRQPNRLPRPWDSPGKNTRVGCHCLFNAWKWKVKVKSLSHVRPSGTPWTAAFQAPPSMGFSRQEYWSGVPLPSPKRSLRPQELTFSLHVWRCFIHRCGKIPDPGKTLLAVEKIAWSLFFSASVKLFNSSALRHKPERLWLWAVNGASILGLQRREFQFRIKDDHFWPLRAFV